MSHFIDDSVVIPSMRQSILKPETSIETSSFFDAPEIDLDAYDNVILCLSTGKDSWASFLHLLDMGVDTRRIEFWHHSVDGHEGSSTLMDWPCVADYATKIASHFDIPLYFSWLEGGMEGEMLKENSYSRPHKVETPDGLITLERDTKRSSPSTRLRFPQVSASLQTRWCSSALKIDVGRRALTNQTRFNGKKVLFITGERRDESPNRGKYNQLEIHQVDRRSGRLGRHVDAWRPVLHWSEERVWDALERHQVLPPVPYRLGWGRSSCMTCIFNGPRVWATLAEYFPEKLAPIADYENKFGVTISRERIGVREIARKARPFEIDDIAALKQAMETHYSLPVVADSNNPWLLPKGAFSEGACGPS